MESTQRLSSAASTDEGFRVYGAGKVSVQIGALGHVVEEGVKGKRSLLAGVLEGSSGAGFATLRYGLGLGDGSRRQAEQQAEAAASRARQTGARRRDMSAKGTSV